LDTVVDKGARHVIYADSAQNLISLYWHPANGGSWTWVNLNQISGAPPIAGGSGLVSFVDSAGSRYVFYIDAFSGHVHRLLWTTSSDWTDLDITATTGCSPAANPALATLNNTSTYSSQVFMIDSQGDVLQAAKQSNGWHCVNLSTSGLPMLFANGLSELSTFAFSGGEKIFAEGPGNGTHSADELLMYTLTGTTVSEQDLTTTAGLPAAIFPGGLVSFLN
jgi:hypothetical protein